MKIRRARKHGSAGRRVLILSILFHAALLLGLSPLLFVTGKGTEPRPAVFLSDVIRFTPPEEDPREEDASPPEAAADLIPETVEDRIPAAVPAFEPLREVRPLTAEIRIPATRSILARPRRVEAPRPPRAEPPRPVIAPARPVRVASVRTAPPRGPSRKATPLAGNAKPRYPSRAMNSGIEGLTLLVVSIGSDGRVLNVRVKRSSGSIILDREAIRAVKSWSFRPALKLGSAVASKVAVPIRFKLR